MVRFLILILLAVVAFLGYRNQELSLKLGQLEGRQVCEPVAIPAKVEAGASQAPASKPDLRGRLSAIQARLQERKARLGSLIQKREALAGAAKKKTQAVDPMEMERRLSQKNEEIDRLKAEMEEARVRGAASTSAPQAAYAEVRSKLSLIEGKIHDAKAGLARLQPEKSPEDRIKRNEIKDQLSGFHAELKLIQEEQKRILDASNGVAGQRPEPYLKRRVDALRKEVARMKKRSSDAVSPAPEDHSLEITDLNRQIQIEQEAIQALELAISEIETLMR